MDAKETVRKLLGAPVVCTLSDGRQAIGTLICVDRLKNLILADCIERRTLVSSDYNSSNDSDIVKKVVTRRLQQAMVPGAQLVKVEMARSIYNAQVHG